MPFLQVVDLRMLSKSATVQPKITLESIMRKHECSSLSLTIPLGLQTCKIIHYPHSPTTPLQLFSFFVWIFPTITALMLPVSSLLTRSFGFHLCLLHMGYPSYQRGGEYSSSIVHKLEVDFSTSVDWSHDTVYTLFTVPLQILPTHWKPKSLEYQTIGQGIHTHKYSQALFFFNLQREEYSPMTTHSIALVSKSRNVP